MGTRLEFQSVLEAIHDGLNVYFQPPENVVMSYPAIVYNRDFMSTEFADNSPYYQTRRYQVMVIDRDPDSPIPDLVAKLQRVTYVRHFTADNLHHDIYYVYF